MQILIEIRDLIMDLISQMKYQKAGLNVAGIYCVYQLLMQK